MQKKVGDLVLIRKDLSMREYGIDTVIRPMLEYRGKVMKISRIINVSLGVKYALEHDSTNCSWTEEMFSKLPDGYVYKEPKFLCREK